LLRRFLSPPQIAALDRFDRVQLADVLRVCQEARSLSAAGRVLFAASRERRRSQNDADRLRKYLQKFAITWTDLQDPPTA
jgi:transcriptional regulatory protein RtcR